MTENKNFHKKKKTNGLIPFSILRKDLWKAIGVSGSLERSDNEEQGLGSIQSPHGPSTHQSSSGSSVA